MIRSEGGLRRAAARTSTRRRITSRGRNSALKAPAPPPRARLEHALEVREARPPTGSAHYGSRSYSPARRRRRCHRAMQPSDAERKCDCSSHQNSFDNLQR
ncbi:hypothetical protein AAFF_G00219420 [Aldrovandia affinis]|uniref:Uncharacterized protein n=1 Tax=Aldrovandia affinis TaxID=143900 RepID=A0AAD7W4L1_9TELE|nr:hypothetical protein AAFF_G00219420 [Aldrovandia affinis]